jgi:endonuclease/exonuclease/phosphatase family metal-dependent hydrolase
LLTSGFKDVAEITNTPFKPTVPTLMNKDKAHAAELRLDYFFINPLLLSRVLRYDVVKTVDTDQMSDHYPIIIELEF